MVLANVLFVMEKDGYILCLLKILQHVRLAEGEKTVCFVKVVGKDIKELGNNI